MKDAKIPKAADLYAKAFECALEADYEEAMRWHKLAEQAEAWENLKKNFDN